MKEKVLVHTSTITIQGLDKEKESNLIPLLFRQPRWACILSHLISFKIRYCQVTLKMRHNINQCSNTRTNRFFPLSFKLPPPFEHTIKTFTQNSQLFKLSISVPTSPDLLHKPIYLTLWRIDDMVFGWLTSRQIRPSHMYQILISTSSFL